MPFFKSAKEKKQWIYTLIVMLPIISTLAIGRPLQELLRDQNVQFVFFLTGMLLTGLTILFHGVKGRPNKYEITITLGIIPIMFQYVV